MSMSQFARDDLPPLSRDGCFWGMTMTQLLGAFNDNLFKQLVLLYCLTAAGAQGGDYQPIAFFLFSIPFVFGSGFSGFLADRYSKRTLIISCKFGEIVVMVAGVLAFGIGGLWAPLLVLFLMGLQSTVFGPSKYGILPEMLRARDLPSANGIIQMTTFVAVIFGGALAGELKELVDEHQVAGLQWICWGCVSIAVVGTLLSFTVRRTPVAVPGLQFTSSMLCALDRPTRALLRKNPLVVTVLLISSLFWFVGGTMHQLVNEFGVYQWKIGDAKTSRLLASIGVGIAIGCISATLLSRHRINFRLVNRGALGMAGCLLSLWAIGWAAPDPVPVMWMWAAGGVLLVLGFCAGIFVVPLQVFLQVSPTEDLKGRMMGTMNLINFCGIVFSAVAFFAFRSLWAEIDAPISWTFPVLALVVLPVAVLFRPPEQEL
jgi:MFS family permease